jgi:2-amino-4-hydroxy-6-hydroxymethyldihydropteridine diphosphokinase
MVSYRIEYMDNIFLLLGTNVGNRKENLRTALKALENSAIAIKKKSRIHKTEPWGETNQPDFLNMAVEVECEYTPHELLNIIKRIEQEMGRKKKAHKWGPRLIDIDILFYGQHVVDEHNVTIPHKEFFNRPFAMKILCEIAPDFMPPHTGKRLVEHLNGVHCGECEIHCH